MRNMRDFAPYENFPLYGIAEKTKPLFGPEAAIKSQGTVK